MRKGQQSVLRERATVAILQEGVSRSSKLSVMRSWGRGANRSHWARRCLAPLGPLIPLV